MTNKPDLNSPLEQASLIAGKQFSLFIAHLQTLDPRLTQTEATLAASAIIRGLPSYLLITPN